MRKKLGILIMLVGAVFVTLAGCGNNSGGTATTKEKESTVEEFTKLVENYSEKQQNLMKKQAEGQSGDFEAVSQHSKDLVASDEYKEWKEVAEKVDGFKVSEKEENAEQFIQLQDAFKEYNKVQMEYFTRLSEATDVDMYNQVNTDLAEQLDDTQTKFINIMNDMNQ
ncbi:hypothetical protein GIX45_17275 [Erwinia sp. CPCC 100877]|nr:hypothetical protein [Erwinia sp. CPCC 100877]